MLQSYYCTIMYYIIFTNIIYYYIVRIIIIINRVEKSSTIARRVLCLRWPVRVRQPSTKNMK